MARTASPSIRVHTEPGHPMDWMAHGLPEWFDLDARLAGLQELPVRLQFFPEDLGASGSWATTERRKGERRTPSRTPNKNLELGTWNVGTTRAARLVRSRHPSRRQVFPLRTYSIRDIGG